MDAVVISDLHLGSHICQHRPLLTFLKLLKHEEIITKELILNGDVFDSLDLKRLNKHHWHCISQIRKLSDHIKVTWVAGNHDGSSTAVSNLLGVNVVDEYIIESGGKSIYFHHGHRYDSFITDHPILTWFSDIIYLSLQKISFQLATLAKKNSKTFLRNSEIIRDKSIEYIEKYGYDVAICGHSHYAIEHPKYYNCGSWTEIPCHYISIDNGDIKVNEYR
jgi:UDP-2,3-diacylglucosamine pyrophosphatase LpxH